MSKPFGKSRVVKRPKPSILLSLIIKESGKGRHEVFFIISVYFLNITADAPPPPLQIPAAAYVPPC